MRQRTILALVLAAGVSAFAAAFAAEHSADARQFLQQIPKKDRIAQALNRLTFGPRPGDSEQVAKMGLNKWIDLQLHPDRIPENPALTEKLKHMDTLAMSSTELVKHYPTPQMVRQMANGMMPLPTDPERRRIVQRQVDRVARKKEPNDPPTPPAANADGLRSLLTPRELRSLRQGTPQERLAAFQALPSEKQTEVVAALGNGIRTQMYPAASPELRRKLDVAMAPQQVVVRDLAESKILRAVHSNRQLNEVLVDFWFNHFNVFIEKGADRFLTTEYEREAIRPHVLGKFRDLLEATAKSPAMLFYLDNWQSVGENTPATRGPAGRQRRGLNENYGRELLELHTLGVDGGYTQKDVTETARCFTGWTINQPQRGGEFLFNPRMHDRGEKTVLGATIAAGGGMDDGMKVLDIVAKHPSTAKFISHKLAQRFVADEPPAALVDRMAQTFLKTGGDMREVMRTLLESKEFWSVGAYRTKVKSPLQMVASAVRAVNGDVDFAFPLVNQLAQLGQPLYRKQEPTGYSNSSEAWLNSAGLVARMNFALQLADGKVPGVKVEAANDGVLLGSPEFQKH
jgi:uncharacterized protein (DUF1800 family)